ATRYLYESTPYVMTYEQPPFTAPAYSYIDAGHLLDFNTNTDETEFFFYPSSWYLTKITSYRGDYIDFTYANNGTLIYTAERNRTDATLPNGQAGYPCGYTLPSNCGYTCNSAMGYNPYFNTGNGSNIFPSYVQPKQSLPNIGDFYSFPTLGESSISTSEIELKSVRFLEINTSNGVKIEFTANTARLDFPGDKRLDKLSIKYNGSLVKEFLFDYQTTNNSQPFEIHS